MFSLHYFSHETEPSGSCFLRLRGSLLSNTDLFVFTIPTKVGESSPKYARVKKHRETKEEKGVKLSLTHSVVVMCTLLLMKDRPLFMLTWR